MNIRVRLDCGIRDFFRTNNSLVVFVTFSKITEPPPKTGHFDSSLTTSSRCELLPHLLPPRWPRLNWTNAGDGWNFGTRSFPPHAASLSITSAVLLVEFGIWYLSCCQMQATGQEWACALKLSSFNVTLYSIMRTWTRAMRECCSA